MNPSTEMLASPNSDDYYTAENVVESPPVFTSLPPAYCSSDRDREKPPTVESLLAMIQELKEDHAREIRALKEDHAREIRALKEDHARDMQSLRDEIRGPAVRPSWARIRVLCFFILWMIGLVVFCALDAPLYLQAWGMGGAGTFVVFGTVLPATASFRLDTSMLYSSPTLPVQPNISAEPTQPNVSLEVK